MKEVSHNLWRHHPRWVIRWVIEWQWVTTFSNFRSVLPVSRLCIGLSGEVTEVHVTSSSVWRHRLQWWVNRWVIMSHNVGESYSETLWRQPTKKVKMGKTYVWRFFSKFSLASLLRVHRTLEYFKIKGTKDPPNGLRVLLAFKFYHVIEPKVILKKW